MAATIMLHGRDADRVKVEVSHRHADHIPLGYAVIDIDRLDGTDLTIFPSDKLIDDLIAALTAYRTAHPAPAEQAAA